MSRVQTTWYAASPDTQFQWATTDNDKFDRELDLYRLAQALEYHTHENGKGLPVGRVADLSITSTMYAALSIPNGAYQDLSITSGKLVDGAVTDAKMANQKTNRAGDVMSGDLRMNRAGADQGALYLGTGNAYMYWDGVSIILNNPTGNRIALIGDGQVYRPGNSHLGYMYLSADGPYVGYDGTNIVASWGASTGIVCTKTNTCEVPMLSSVMFSTTAQLTAAGARFARNTNVDGRMIAGAGLAGVGGVTLAENTFYGTSWAPGSVLGISNTLGVSGGAGQTITNVADTTNVFLAAAAAVNNGVGATNVSTAAHVNPNTLSAPTAPSLTGAVTLTGLSTNYLPPTYAAIWGVRIA